MTDGRLAPCGGDPRAQYTVINPWTSMTCVHWPVTCKMPPKQRAIHKQPRLVLHDQVNTHTSVSVRISNVIWSVRVYMHLGMLSASLCVRVKVRALAHAYNTHAGV